MAEKVPAKRYRWNRQKLLKELYGENPGYLPKKYATEQGIEVVLKFDGTSDLWYGAQPSTSTKTSG